MANDIIKIQYENEYIAIVTMADLKTKNCFSSSWTEGMESAFEELKKQPKLKVVIIQGIGSYFHCGGTKEELIAISEGKRVFTDIKFYRILLDCDWITIAAMQGHAMGGGLVFGLYADIQVMGEECYYTANFMNFGFTPGIGATYLIPKKCGDILGCEILYTGKNFKGKELREKGMGATIVKKADVLTYALQIAKDLADKPLISLKLLKKRLTKEIKTGIEQAINDELDMHQLTFGQPEVKEKIYQINQIT